MIELDLTGTNSEIYPHLATWHWHVALYLFAGGLVAGMMIFSGVFRLMKRQDFDRAVLITDWLALPLLAGGMLLLWFDLANRWNAWRFFTTVQLSSPMSWGSWILLASMLVLGLRLLTRLPLLDFQPASRRWLRAGQRLWQLASQLGQKMLRWTGLLDIFTVSLGISLGLYTGVLLNTIPARPLWDTNVLPFLFLVSGLACGGAFLAIFISGNQIRKLVPVSITVGVLELILIIGYIWSLVSGTEATQQASDLLFSTPYAVGFWGMVVLVGLIVPFSIEILEIVWRKTPQLLARLAPILTLIGGASLRFVVVYAGMQSAI